MPMYEYSCRACSHVFETLTSAKRGEPESCPKCGGAEVERLIALPAAGRIESSAAPTNCRGDGPPCGAPWCGRQRMG